MLFGPLGSLTVRAWFHVNETVTCVGINPVSLAANFEKLNLNQIFRAAGSTKLN